MLCPTFLLLLSFTQCATTRHTRQLPATAFPYFLQPLLAYFNGTPVESPAAWSSRRVEIAAALESTILGTRPTSTPPLARATVLNSTRVSGAGLGGATEIFVELEFTTPTGPVAFVVEVIVPLFTVPSLLPVFLTQWTHRAWANVAVSRGYVGVVYPAADSRDAAPDFQRAYGLNATSMALIHARAFVASRVLDYVLGPTFGDGFPTPAPTVNASAVCISGHSRNGKQSVIAAAFDERFTAVVGSSPGAPVSTPWQFGSHNFYGEVPSASLPSAWWIASTALFDSNPEDLLVDGHGLLAMIAPRHLAISTAWTDREGDLTVGTEAGVSAARDVFSLLKAPSGALTILHRPGDHHGFNDVHTFFDFFDAAFGRLSAGFPLGYAGDTDPFALTFLTAVGGFNWSVWNASFGASTPLPPSPASPLVERMSWLAQLSESGSGGQFGRGSTYAEDMPANFRYPSVMMSADFDYSESGVPSPFIRRVSVSIGDYLTANVYFPANATGTLPAVIWLHPYSYATGYVAAYTATQVVPALVTGAGAVVVAFDFVGFGSRLKQGGTTFFARHGGSASPFGHMVRDVRAAVDFLTCASAAGACWVGGDVGDYPDLLNSIPSIDATRIFAAGYSLGGNVALHAAATDTRIAGVAVVSAFTPFRTDTDTKPTGGTRRLSEIHAVLPRLGLFRGSELAVPYDYDELIASLAPRPILILSAKLDRDATFADVAACVDAARVAWGGDGALFNHTVTEGGTNMGDFETSMLVSWLRGAAA